MERWEYTRPFDLVEFPADQPAHFVVLADYVTIEDGSGLVHQSPAFGEEDMAVCRGYGLPVVTPVPDRRPLRGRDARWSAGSSSSTPTPTWSATSRRAD